MPLRDTAAMDASLDNDYGLTAGPHSPPGGHVMALYVGDPMTPDSEELNSTDDPGYAREAVTQAMWNDSEDGYKSTDPVQFNDSTGPWLHEATHWALLDGDVMWDCAPLVEPLAVTAAATGPKVVVTVFYDDGVPNPE